jgi:SAM-dependent methyltransferase
VPAQYFVDLYKREIDPWGFETSEYERAKYDATLAALRRSGYDAGLELACSIGVFTSRLAERCKSLLAVDVSSDALRRARQNCAKHAHVRFERRVLPSDYPDGLFDLTTVCEMGFYLSAADLRVLRENVIAHSRAGAHVLLVHWTPPVKGHASTAEEVHAAFCDASQLRWLQGFSKPTYRLDLLERY